MKKGRLIFILTSIFILLVFSSCSPESKTWNIAKSNNDISSFEYYIETYPLGEYSDSANIYIKNIREAQKEKPFIISKIISTPIASWANKECKEICLKFSISAPQSKEYEIDSKEKGSKILKKYFELRGIELLPLSEDCETRLLIDLKMKAFGTSYFNFGYLYTGYQIKGTYLLKTNGHTPIKGNIFEEEPIAKQVEKKTQYGGTTYKVDLLRTVGPKPFSPFPNLKSLVLNEEFLSKLWKTPDLSSTPLDTQFPEYYTNYIYRLFCSLDHHDRGNAESMINSKYFDRKPENIIPLITYNTSIYGLRDQKLKYSNLGLEVIEKMGVSAIDAAPILIELMASRNNISLENEYVDLKNKYIEEILEIITGNKNEQLNDISSWRAWWFDYKKSDLRE